jgi:signal transduction histidine kinase
MQARGRSYVRHFLQVLGFDAVVAIALAYAKDAPWDVQMVYAQATGLTTWALIDFGRIALRPDADSGWPHGARGVALVAVGIVVGAAVGLLIGDAYAGHSTWRLASLSPRALLSTVAVSIALSALATAWYYTRGKAQWQRARTAAAERDAAEARLALLQSQLEPHMLFNTLANLRALIASDPQRAQAMLDQLIAFLRATLGASRTTLHPLADEFARLDDYLHLMQVRMGTRLQSRLDLPDDLAAQPVPPLVLQPLVENAIQHGLEPHVAGGRLDVSATREAGELVLRVRDTGAGLSRASTGGSHFGLQQVRERLIAMYGAAASLDLAAADDDDGGTLATIRMPMRDAAARPRGRPRHATVQSDP